MARTPKSEPVSGLSHLRRIRRTSSCLLREGRRCSAETCSRANQRRWRTSSEESRKKRSEAMAKSTIGLLVVSLLFAHIRLAAQGQQSPKQEVRNDRVAVNPLICKRPATPAHQIDIDRCHGNWSPLDNTNNWKYQAITGKDHFVRRTETPVTGLARNARMAAASSRMPMG